MRNIYKYLDRKTFGTVMLGRVLNGGVVLAQPLILSKALNLEQGGLSYQKILSFALYGFSVYLVIYSLMLFSNHSHNIFRREIHKNVRSILFRKLVTNPHYSNEEKISILTQDMEFLGDYYFEVINHMLSWGFVSLVTAVYILAQDFVLGSIFVVFTVMRPIPQFIMNQRLKNSGDEMSQLRSRVHALLSDSMHGSQALTANQALKENEKRIFTVNEDYQRAIQKFAFTHNIIYFFNGFMVFLSQVVPLTVGFYLTINGQFVSVARLIAMYIAAGMLVDPIQNLMYDVVHLQGSLPTAEKIFKIIENDPDYAENSERVLSGIESLEIEQLSKSFGQRRLFSDLNASIKMGEKVLIKGPSGSGKTTLFRLILGQEEADTGQVEAVCADGQRSKVFQGNIGVISQQPFLFNETIRYNLALEQPFEDNQLIKALKRVGLYDEFDDILNVVVHNNGENISGGQRVRIELARFLLREKDILLADEVTAALDEKNARKVRQLLFSLPIMVLEIAHHIDDETQYNQVIELKQD